MNLRGCFIYFTDTVAVVSCRSGFKLKMGFNKPRILKTIPILSLGTTLSIVLLNYPRKNCPSKGKLELNHSLKQDVGELQACSAIIQGDVDGVDKESFYLNATKDCPSYIRGFLTVSLSKEEKDFPIAYSMVIHEKIEMFERLLRAIYTPHNVYCVHVDQKSPEIFKEAVRAITSCLTNVFVASKLEHVIYSSPPIKTPMFSGNAYFVVSREFVEHIFKSKEIQDFMEWEKDTYSPDEHMWATLQRMPSVPGSNPPNIKYQQSDVNAIARLVKWSYFEELKNGAP
uniref:Beta-1,3-galactosyl-O-glycosyl-glycoprotein beta-1,6-N-acetylglucosaminyltransferase 3 n=1 Tax=Sinocyclocheilus anshuiensis TaxID=1608454 RepID=A0A671T189_9TELE